MGRDKLRHRDQGANSIGSNNVIPNSLTIDDIKIQDTGDASSINAETLPYRHTALTPSIWTKIESIIAGTDWVKDEFVANGTDNSFVLSNIVNQTKPFLVFYNGQQMRYGPGNDFSITGGDLIFSFIPVLDTPIYILYQI